METYHFTATIIQEDKFYVARAVELGVVSQGTTIDVAKKNLREAVELYLEDAPELKKRYKNKTPLLTVLDARV